MVALAADPPEGCGPGGPRLLAAGGGRVAVWQEDPSPPPPPSLETREDAGGCEGGAAVCHMQVLASLTERQWPNRGNRMSVKGLEARTTMRL